MRIIGLLFLSTVAIGIHAQSTTVVVHRTPRDVILAVDSLARTQTQTIDDSGNEFRSTGIMYVCKIVAVSGKAASFTGWLPGHGSSVVRASAARALDGSANIASSAEAFSESISEMLRAAVEDMRINHIREYRLATLKEGSKTVKPVFRAIFVAVEGGSPTIADVSWTVLNTEVQPVRMAPDIRVLPDGKVFTPKMTFNFFGGYYDEIAKHRNSGSFWAKHGSINGARKLVELMSVARPLDVGGPIDILRITKHGSEWVSPEPKCDNDGKRVASPVPRKEKEIEPTPKATSPKRRRHKR